MSERDASRPWKPAARSFSIVCGALQVSASPKPHADRSSFKRIPLAPPPAREHHQPQATSSANTGSRIHAQFHHFLSPAMQSGLYLHCKGGVRISPLMMFCWAVSADYIT